MGVWNVKKEKLFDEMILEEKRRNFGEILILRDSESPEKEILMMNFFY
jgi:hypothetical protein